MIIAGINGFLATGLAAMGTHVFTMDNHSVSLYQQASHFHFIHTTMLIICAVCAHIFAHQSTVRWVGRAAIFFIIGMACFSGSLYWRAIMGPGSLGNYHWVTPLGGLALMGGWLTLVQAFYLFKTKI